MRDHALELVPVELLHEAGRDGHDRMPGIAAGGEGIGRRIVDHVDRRHRHPGRDRHLMDDVEQHLVMGRFRGPRGARGQRHGRASEPADEKEDPGHRDRHGQARPRMAVERAERGAECAENRG